MTYIEQLLRYLDRESEENRNIGALPIETNGTHAKRDTHFRDLKSLVIESRFAL
jgi:hypothetical protein